MEPKREKPGRTRWVFLALTVGLLAFSIPAYAATRTWDGGGGDNNWSTAANWSSDTVPVPLTEILA